MATTVKLSDAFVEQARIHAGIYHRSVPKQIEFWSHIGKIAEENPDLSYQFIKVLLLAQQELLVGNVVPYQFG